MKVSRQVVHTELLEHVTQPSGQVAHDTPSVATYRPGRQLEQEVTVLDGSRVHDKQLTEVT